MALNALLEISDAKGESNRTEGKEKIEIQGWDWEVESETSWTKGGGAAIGKPNPGKFSFEHYFDRSSPVIMRYIFSGKSFDKITLQMFKATGVVPGSGNTGQSCFFTMVMGDSFITKVSNTATDEGNIVQKVELVFKDVSFEYFPQLDDTGKLDRNKRTTVSWNIPAGTVGD